MRSFLYAPIVAFLALAACSSSSSEPSGPTDGGHVDASVDSGADAGPLVIKASDYDQSCTKNEDCVQITEGDACAECGCYNAAINASDTAKEASQAAALAAKCPPRQPVNCGACGESQALCTGGKCVLHQCSGGVCPDAGADDGGDAGADAAGE